METFTEQPILGKNYLDSSAEKADDSGGDGDGGSDEPSGSGGAL
jgi:hypothetical protein